MVRQKFAKIRENYKELHLDMEGGYAVMFRAYNEGVAYRLETSLPRNRGENLRRREKLNFPRNFRRLLSPGGEFFLA